jgi:hypothetical protein
MCAYVDGQQVGGCLDLPATVAMIPDAEQRNLATVNWILSTLTGSGRDWNAPVSFENVHLLSSGSYTNRDGQLIRFSLPEGLNLNVVQVRTGMA